MIKVIAKILLLLSALSLGTNTVRPTDERTYAAPPSVDISAIRYIICAGEEGFYSGSGFLIGDHILATADHIARGTECYDMETNAKLTTYYEDPQHDFALMTSTKLPTNIPYERYACQSFKKDQPYISYGITDYNEQRPIIRNNTLVSTGTIINDDHAVGGGFPHSSGMTLFNGAIAPGMSGGPVTDIWGNVVAVNNAGDSKTTLLFSLKDTILCSAAANAVTKNLKKPV